MKLATTTSSFPRRRESRVARHQLNIFPWIPACAGMTKLVSLITITLWSLLLVSTPATALNNNDIVVSIKPLHSLVANITQGISHPVLILSASGSPHTRTLKPSNARALANAKIIFWIGRQVETFLQKPIANLGRNAKVISFPPDTKNTKNNDPHIWLNPLNAMNMVRTIAATLSKLDPKNASTYQANLKTTIARLDALDHHLSNQLTNTKPFLVFHNAYSHLAQRYKLNIVDVLVNNPELKPGAKHIRKIRRMLQTAKAGCIFSEPQFDKKIITTLINGTKTKAGTLDPIGSNIATGPEHYFDMMKQLANNLQNCR